MNYIDGLKLGDYLRQFGCTSQLSLESLRKYCRGKVPRQRPAEAQNAKWLPELDSNQRPLD